MHEEREIRPELQAGERLIWSGQPRGGLRFGLGDLYTVPFGLLFLGFSVVWVTVAYQGLPIMALFGIPFLLMGAYIAFGRFFVEARQRANMYYAVTDRRVIIVSGLRSRTVKSLDLSTLHDLSVTERRNGRGTVDFGGKSGFEKMVGQFGAFGSFGFNPMDASSFQLIEQPREVYNEVLDARRAAMAPTS